MRRRLGVSIATSGEYGFVLSLATFSTALPTSAVSDILPSMSAFDLQSTYVCLSPNGDASPLPVTPEFWATIHQRKDVHEGRLVAVFSSNTDWPNWEMHPHGEEVLVLLSGKMTMILEEGRAEKRVELKKGLACIVPRGTWHRAIVPVPSQLLAITYGRETKHRNRSE